MLLPQEKRKCGCIKCLLCIASLFISINSIAQLKWDGEGGDGLWATPANWVGNIIPSATDDVVLDNSILSSNYSVSLPGSSFAVVVKTIVIAPTVGNTIQFVIPASNTAAPAFTAAGAGYGIIINNGGLFVNSSGSTSNASVAVTDSIKINNGGQYTHNTRSSHAVLVSSLSKAPGTEKGIFEFDVPGGGYTIATTKRTYGTLVLSSNASAGSQVYSSSAASALTINGDFIINAGVTINLDLTAATTIYGNYIQRGGTFNLASQANNNTVNIKGDFTQTTGTITETSTGLPAIELNGNVNQNITASGSILNSVDVRINNTAGITLLTGLSLPYHLNLTNGIINANSFLVTLQADCGITADSLSNQSFINGALRKEGLTAADHFLFPVGKDITQRWLELKNTTGSYTIEFFKGNPKTIATAIGIGVHHTSSIEYWTIKADAAPAPMASVELSFDNVNSGGVTDMATLRVAQLVSGIWANKGNAATTGTPGSAGSVVSNSINVFDPSVDYFTLASSDAFQNPLPIVFLSFNGESAGKDVIVKWSVAETLPGDYFELQSSADGNHFGFVSRINALPGQKSLQYLDQNAAVPVKYYRLKLVQAGGNFVYSSILKLANIFYTTKTIQVWPSVVKDNAKLFINSTDVGNATISIYNMHGRVQQNFSHSLIKGNNIIPLQLQLPANGEYIIVVRLNDKILNTRFIKVDD